MHKYQHIYLPPFIHFIFINWLFDTRFQRLLQQKKIIWKVTTIPTVEYIKLFLFKAFFLLHDCFTGALFKVSFATAFTAFLVMMFTANALYRCSYY